MSMNQLHQLAQRSCFNLPAYTFIRKGPDHSPRFKASVNFNGEVFDSPRFFRTLQHAKHAAAKVALQFLCSHGPLKSLIAKILDETGVYKNLLQEISQRVGAPLPLYTTIRSGLGHLPVFTCTVELAGIEFTGEPAKNKKQAEKNAAMAAWFSLKQLAKKAASTSSEPDNNDEQEQITIARALLNYRLKEKVAMAKNPLATPFPKKFPVQPEKKPSLTHQAPSTRSKLLPLIQPNSVTKMRPSSPLANDRGSLLPDFLQPENHGSRPHKFPAAGAAPYVPVRNFSMPYRGMAPPVTIRTAVPCFSSLPRPNQPGHQLPPVMNLPVRMASPVRIRPAVPVFAAPTPKPAMLPIIPGQPKEQPQFAVKYMLPDAVLPDIKSIPPTVAVASSDPPVTRAHLKIELAHIAVASRDPLLMPGQGKEQPPVAVELPPDVVLPDSPFKPVLLGGSSTIVPSAEAMQRVQTEEVTDSAENDLLEIGALECFKRLEI